MPGFLLHFLNSRTLKQHLWMAIGIGLFFRLCSAYFAYGPQAMDDYTHAVLPAYNLWAGLPMGLPEYRSPLIVWLLSVPLNFGSLIGLSAPITQIRLMLGFLGLISLSAIFGTYLYVRAKKEDLGGKFALYLVAISGLVPYASTRAFGESIALGFVVLAFGILELAQSPRRPLFLGFVGFLFLGLAILFRFHVGLMAFTYGIILLYRQQWKILAGGSLAAALALVLQTLCDASMDRGFMGTLKNYFAANADGGAIHGVQPWFTTWLLVLAVTLFPFSIVFYRQLGRLWKKHWSVLAPMLVFIAAHSINPHKEERFMYPVLGLLLIFLALVWVAEKDNWFVRRVYAPMYAGFFGIILIVSSFLNSQVGAVETAERVTAQFHAAVFVDFESLLGKSFLRDMLVRPPHLVTPGQEAQLISTAIEPMFSQYSSNDALVFVTSNEDLRPKIEAMAGSKGAHFECGSPVVVESVIDRFLRRMNPQKSKRRIPSWYVECHRT